MKNNNKLVSLEEDPFDLFAKWFSLAKKNEINDPNAMCLSTANKKLQISSRMVLLKSFNRNGFIFNTNINSRKGEVIKSNSSVAINFHWKSLRKQVHIEGYAKLLNTKDADRLFHSRPKMSKIGAWASNQSSNLKYGREELLESVDQFKKQFKNKAIPRPKHWSGYRIIPQMFEFWQDMPYRLHHRVIFLKSGKNRWIAKNLYP